MPAIDRVNAYVAEYNKYRSIDINRAIDMGERAVAAAKEGLKENGIGSPQKAHFMNVIKEIGEFLANPSAYAVAPKNAGGGEASEDKIKSTDWFAAPIPQLSMKNIAGLQDVKDEFIVNVFAPTYPDLSPIYKKYRGEEVGLQILLYGPPGTGKTHVVKCLAGELQCKIAVVQIKDVMANLVGDGAKIIAEIFEQAKQFDRCIIFFDEIDAIASSREGDDSRHTKEQLTTLLTNMDGFTSATKPGQLRIVIAATNRPWALDSAVKRGGRFDTQILVPIPDSTARKKLIEMHFSDSIPRDADVTTDWLVENTVGYAGADIKSICRQAAGRPLKREIKAALRKAPHADKVTRQDFEAVLKRYINSTTRAMLDQYNAYSMGMTDIEYKKYVLNMTPEQRVEHEAHLLNLSFEEFVVYKGKELLGNLFQNYASEKSGKNDVYSKAMISKLDIIIAKYFYEKGLFAKYFDTDLSFLDTIIPIECKRFDVN